MLALKWLATTTLIVGTGVNALGYYPLGPLLLAAGGLMWLAVAIQWGDTALITTNAVMSAVGIFGLIAAHWG